jgi:hypothetical protein
MDAPGYFMDDDGTTPLTDVVIHAKYKFKKSGKTLRIHSGSDCEQGKSGVHAA